jgi:hypothetical protein
MDFLQEETKAEKEETMAKMGAEIETDIRSI